MTCNVGCTSTPVIEALRKPDCERGSSRPDVLPALQLRAVDVDLSASEGCPPSQCNTVPGRRASCLGQTPLTMVASRRHKISGEFRRKFGRYFDGLRSRR